MSRVTNFHSLQNILFLPKIWKRGKKYTPVIFSYILHNMFVTPKVSDGGGGGENNKILTTPQKASALVEIGRQEEKAREFRTCK